MSREAFEEKFQVLFAVKGIFCLKKQV
jgi:hypothetical protein